MAAKRKLKFLTLNVRGLREKSKRQTIFNWLKGKKHNVILLQETHSDETVEIEWKKEWGSSMYFSHGETNSKGVAILLDKDYDFEIKEIAKDKDGRILFLEVVLNGDSIMLGNVYGPTKNKQKDQIEFVQQISSMLDAHRDKNIVIGGDFNICQDTTLDKNTVSNETMSLAAKSIQNLKDDFNLIDIWRVLNPTTKRYTWRGKTKTGHTASRIDYWLTSNNLIYDIHKTDILPSIKSDHSLLLLTLVVHETQQRGRGFWKFNCSLLRDKEYVDKINQFLENCSDDYKNVTDKSLVWDAIKCHIRGITIAHSKHTTKIKRQMLKDITQELHEMEKGLDEGDIELLERYNSLKREYERIQDNFTRGIVVRSRAKWIEDGEKNTKYFLQLEKQNSKLKSIKALDINDNIVTNADEVMSECEKYYKTLYTNDSKVINDDTENPFLNAEHPMLEEEEKRFCDRSITIDECLKSLKELPNNKSPGSDGLPADFYKFFWNNIKSYFFQSYQYSIENGMLSRDQRQAILTLIPKKDKDLRHLKNWRPLSLLNTDYKIIAKVLASRLQTVIANIIDDDQVGYIKGRFIGENIRTMLDVIELTSSMDEPGFLIMIDFEKAFDSVSWKFMFSVIDYFNFGTYFKKHIKLLYSNPLCCVSNNGHMSKCFETKRGIRQGCPISALLFILCVETLAINIRKNMNIKGIKVGSTEIKISQYADDTCLYLKDTPSIEKTLKVFECFYRYAGLRLNQAKTEILKLGNHNLSGKVCGLNLINKPIRVLGITVTKDKNEIVSSNVTTIIEKIKHKLNMWKQRNLTIKGRITVLKSQAMPLLLFIANVLYIPKDKIEEIQRIFNDFVWPHNKTHVKNLTLIEDIENGGLKMPNIHSMVKANKLMWIKRMIIKTKSINATAKALIDTTNLTMILSSKNNIQFMKIQSDFYRQIISYWHDVHNMKPQNMSEVIEEILWDNENILINSKPLFNQHWINHGINKVKDILNDNCVFLTREEIEAKYNIQCSIMYHNSLITSIPSGWKKMIKGQEINASMREDKCNLTLKIDKNLTNIKDIPCRMIYWAEIHKISKRPTSYDKWELEYDYTHFDWQTIAKIPFKSARETSLQSLQYQIINRYFPCQEKLYTWKIKESNLCPTCNKVDSLVHYFVDCNQVKILWGCLKTWCNYILKFKIQFGPLDILLGIPNYANQNEIDILNFIILFAKMFIKTCKNENKTIDFYDFQLRLKQRMIIEKQIMLSDGKSDIYDKKWKDLDENL